MPVVVFITRLGSIRGMLLFTGALFLILFKLRHNEKRCFSCWPLGSDRHKLLAKFFPSCSPTLWMSPAPEDDYSFPSVMGTMAVISALVILTWPTRAAHAHPGRTIRSDGWSVPFT